MARTEGISPPFPKHLRIDADGRPWTRKEGGVKGYSSDDGNYDILQGNGYVVLVSFIHDPNERGQEFWRKQFRTVKEAMKAAELM